MTSDSQLDVCAHKFAERHEYQGEVWWQCSNGCDVVLVPRDEALAAQGAVIEQAAQHPLETDAELATAGCGCGIEFEYGNCESLWQDHIRSLATAPMQAALEQQQASVAAYRQLVLDILPVCNCDFEDGSHWHDCWRSQLPPVNEAALEKVKADMLSELRNLFIMMQFSSRDERTHEGAVKAGVYGAVVDTLKEHLRRDAEKQTP